MRTRKGGYGHLAAVERTNRKSGRKKRMESCKRRPLGEKSLGNEFNTRPLDGAVLQSFREAHFVSITI